MQRTYCIQSSYLSIHIMLPKVSRLKGTTNIAVTLFAFMRDMKHFILQLPKCHFQNREISSIQNVKEIPTTLYCFISKSQQYPPPPPPTYVLILCNVLKLSQRCFFIISYTISTFNDERC